MSRVVLILLTLLVTSSCMKKLADSDNDGPSASSDDVQNSLVKAWGVVDPLTIQKNEFVYMERTQKIQQNDPALILQEGVTVSDRQDTGDDIVYTLLHQINDLTNGSGKPSTTEEQVSVAKDPSTSQAMKQMSLLAQGNPNVDIHQMELGIQTVQGLLSLCIKADNWDVECHNLVYSEEDRPAPDLVKAQDNCAGLPNCQIHVRKVSFDILLNVKNDDGSTEKQKIQYSVGISPDVPYLSRLMDFCYRGMVMVPAAGEKVLVEVCSEVKNFKIGQN